MVVDVHARKRGEPIAVAGSEFGKWSEHQRRHCIAVASAVNKILVAHVPSFALFRIIHRLACGDGPDFEQVI